MRHGRGTVRIRRGIAVLCAGGLGIAGCAHYPAGPSVMALPGHGATFEEFQTDDASCRDWAAQSAGVPQNAAAASGIGAAAVGTAIGAVAGTAIGAAAGHPGAGAAIGAGSGLLVGSAVGADRARYVGGAIQHRYDTAYIQCMYAKGHQVPLPGSAARAYRSPMRSPLRAPSIPPPPKGAPPAPPPSGTAPPPPPSGAPPPPPPNA